MLSCGIHCSVNVYVRGCLFLCLFVPSTPECTLLTSLTFDVAVSSYLFLVYLSTHVLLFLSILLLCELIAQSILKT